VKLSTVNYQNRQEEHDFTDYQVVITGGRVKIGFSTTLKFLRSGAKVLATTRFPGVAWEQYAKEDDFNQYLINISNSPLHNFKSPIANYKTSKIKYVHTPEI